MTTIGEVRTILGENTNDLSELCNSDNINVFSLYKPVKQPEVDVDRSSTWYMAENRDYGILLTGNPEDYSVTSIGSTSLYSRVLNLDFNYELDKVGTDYPSRLLDFDGYVHETQPYVQIVSHIVSTRNSANDDIGNVLDLDLENEFYCGLIVNITLNLNTIDNLVPISDIKIYRDTNGNTTTMIDNTTYSRFCVVFVKEGDTTNRNLMNYHILYSPNNDGTYVTNAASISSGSSVGSNTLNCAEGTYRLIPAIITSNSVYNSTTTLSPIPGIKLSDCPTMTCKTFVNLDSAWLRKITVNGTTYCALFILCWNLDSLNGTTNISSDSGNKILCSADNPDNGIPVTYNTGGNTITISTTAYAYAGSFRAYNTISYNGVSYSLPFLYSSVIDAERVLTSTVSSVTVGNIGLWTVSGTLLQTISGWTQNVSDIIEISL